MDCRRKEDYMFPNLLAEMARKGIFIKDLSECVGIDRSTMSLKMNGIREFKLNEMKVIKDTFFPDLTYDYLFEKK